MQNPRQLPRGAWPVQGVQHGAHHGWNDAFVPIAWLTLALMLLPMPDHPEPGASTIRCRWSHRPVPPT